MSHGRRRRIAGVLGLAAVAVIGLAPETASASNASADNRSVIIAVVADDPQTLPPTGHKSDEPRSPLLRRLAGDGFAVGLLSTDLGRFDRRQTLLDLSQGTRQPGSLYGTRPAPVAYPATGGSTCIAGWSTLTANAHDASVTLIPGLLAGSVPDGAAFVGVSGDPLSAQSSIVAADRRGCLSDVSLGSPSDLAPRVAQAAAGRRLVVAGVPGGPTGLGIIESLQAGLTSDQLLIVVAVPPNQTVSRLQTPFPTRFYNQTEIGVRGPGWKGRLHSATTRRPGLVAAIDVAPTALRFLGIALPEQMRGQVMASGGHADASALEGLRRRWADVRSNRQLPSFEMLLILGLAWFGVLAVITDVRRAVGPAMRAWGLAILWWAAACLGVALVAPREATVEVLAIAALALVLGIVTDRVLPWPRGPAAPAAVLLVGLAVDLATGGRVLTQSVIGPSVASGSRFYGISNELEPVIPVVLLAGLAAVTTWRRRDATPRTLVYGVVGTVVAVVVGWGRLGADVGGVITVGAGFAGAVAIGMGRLTRRRVAFLIAVPVVAVVALVGLDLVSRGGDHLSNNLSRSGGRTDLWELVARRYQLAFHVLGNGAIDIRLGVALLGVALVVRNRGFFLGPEVTPAWRAALLGGLAAGVAGALANDSGPVLLVNAVFILAGVVLYLGGRNGASQAWSPGESQRWDTVGSRG